MRGQMPAFDGRRDRTDWLPIPTISNGWTTTGQYVIRDGWCILRVYATKPAWGPEQMFVVPVGARPSVYLPFNGYSLATAGHVPLSIDASGNVECLFGSTTTGGGGILATITYPVG